MNRLESPSDTKALLRMRAEKYAAEAASERARAVVDTVVVLGIGGQKIGISSVRLGVIGKAPPVAPLPEMPSLIRGVVQIRGEVMAAVDIARWLQIGSGRSAPLIAVVEDVSRRKLGLLVDEVIGFREIAKDELVENFFGNKVEREHPVSGTTRDLIAIIDVSKLFLGEQIAISQHIVAREKEKI